MIPGYCINTVEFIGENQQLALEYFKGKEAEEHYPPFLAIMVYDNAVHFDSRWVPPIRSLNEVAEQFDVSYHIDYRVPYEDRGSYFYTCLQQEDLSDEAHAIRETINSAVTIEELEDADALVTRHVLAQSLNLHELEVLSYIAGKKYNVFRLQDIQDRADEGYDFGQEDDTDRSPRIGR